MSSTGSRTTTLVERTLFAMNVALLVWLVVRATVPAHPVEQPVSLLLVAGALVSMSAAPLLRTVALRRIAIGLTIVLVVATFWRL